MNNIGFDNFINRIRLEQTLKKTKLPLFAIGISISIMIFLVLGIPSALIPTSLFQRMIPATSIDYVFLVLASIMSGAFVSLHFYGKRKTNIKNDYIATGGAVASIFAFSCPICNALLVSLFGTSIILFYFEPLRPILGIIGIAVLGIALYNQIKKN